MLAVIVVSCSYVLENISRCRYLHELTILSLLNFIISTVYSVESVSTVVTKYNL